MPVGTRGLRGEAIGRRRSYGMAKAKVKIKRRSKKRVTPVASSKGRKGPPKTKAALAKARKRPGGSNVGKERETSSAGQGPFCGTVSGSFPVTSEKQARAALAYARHDPNPQKVKNCVYRIAEAKGWFSRPGKGKKK